MLVAVAASVAGLKGLMDGGLVSGEAKDVMVLVLMHVKGVRSAGSAEPAFFATPRSGVPWLWAVHAGDDEEVWAGLWVEESAIAIWLHGIVPHDGSCLWIIFRSKAAIRYMR